MADAPDRCPTCGLDDPALHPCDASGCAYPCPDDYHREASIKTCAEPDCAAMGLTKARAWRCAVHHPEHPANAYTPPSRDEWERTKSNERMFLALVEAAKIQANADAPLLKVMRDLGCDQPAGGATAMRCTISGGPYVIERSRHAR